MKEAPTMTKIPDLDMRMAFAALTMSLSLTACAASSDALATAANDATTADKNAPAAASSLNRAAVKPQQADDDYFVSAATSYTMTWSTPVDHKDIFLLCQYQSKEDTSNPWPCPQQLNDHKKIGLHTVSCARRCICVCSPK